MGLGGFRCLGCVAEFKVLGVMKVFRVCIYIYTHTYIYIEVWGVLKMFRL